MSNTPLLEAIRAQSAKIAQPMAEAEYRGAATAARFTDPQQEFSALKSGCGIYDLGFRARLSLTGGDRTRWLNGMVTNNIRDLAAGHGVYAFLLNPQGRILGDMYAYNDGGRIVVETDRSQVEKIVATFDHYIIMDDVEVKDISDQQSALGLSGTKGTRRPEWQPELKSRDLQPLQMITPQCNCDCGCVQCTVIRGDGPEECYELWLAPKDVFKTWQALIAAGAAPVGSEALEMQRIVAGIPLYGVDIHERDLPQETEQTRALNFNKGCYVGQEIVERIRSRGNVHRKFTGFVVEGAVPIAAGSQDCCRRKRSWRDHELRCRLRPPDQTVALGYIRREVGMPGREVTIGNHKAVVMQLPLTRFLLDPRNILCCTQLKSL